MSEARSQCCRSGGFMLYLDSALELISDPEFFLTCVSQSQIIFHEKNHEKCEKKICCIKKVMKNRSLKNVSQYVAVRKSWTNKSLNNVSSTMLQYESYERINLLTMYVS